MLLVILFLSWFDLASCGKYRFDLTIKNGWGWDQGDGFLGGVEEAYIKVSMDGIDMGQTAVVDGPNPSWNKHFYFDERERNTDLKKIEIQLWEDDGGGNDDDQYGTDDIYTNQLSSYNTKNICRQGRCISISIVRAIANPPQLTPVSSFMLLTPSNNKCLSSDKDNNNKAVTQLCDSSNTNQQWYYDMNTNALKMNEKCLDYHYGADYLYSHDCHNNNNQQWQYIGDSFRTPYNYKCLTVFADSTQLELGDCDKNEDKQKWISAMIWNDEDKTVANNLFQNKGWYRCPKNYIFAGFYRSDCQKLYCLESMKCVAPKDDLSGNQEVIPFAECKKKDIWSDFDKAGDVKCEEGYFINGIYVTGGTAGLGWIEELECCSYNDKDIVYGNIETHDWLYDFDNGKDNKWSLVDNTQFIIGLNREGSYPDNDEIYYLDAALVRKLYKTSVYFGVAIFVKERINGDQIGIQICWNNKLYKGDITIQTVNHWFFSQSLSFLQVCNDDHTATITRNEGEYVISQFKLIDIKRKRINENIKSVTNSYIISSFEGKSISLNDTNKEYIIEYPDDYLTACDDENGCIGKAIDSANHKEYKITITQCSSYNPGANTDKIGVIVRGIKGNLDKTILGGNEFIDKPIGYGDIGDIMHVLLEHEDGSNICIEKVTIINPFDLGKVILFENDHFGNGIFLSKDCKNEYFSFLTDTSYIPCYDTPFAITTYQKSNYTSIEIKTCTGSESGVISDSIWINN